MNSTVAVIDYGSGNLRSAAKSLERAAASLPLTIKVTSNPKEVAVASHIVLPGVGAFGDCMKGLHALDGMVEQLTEHVLQQQKPFLGICVGMQLLAQKGLEHGEYEGLGWIKGEVVPINPPNPQLKVPHMGWNALELLQDHPVLTGIHEGDHAYFVHSFHMVCDDNDRVLSTVSYGKPLTAIIAKDNIVATQFHPEKSQKTGLRLLENFLRG